MPQTITITKNKYELLKEQARAYEEIKKTLARGGFFKEPPVKKTKEILKEFNKSGLYNKKFLKSLGKGLLRSDYFA